MRYSLVWYAEFDPTLHGRDVLRELDRGRHRRLLVRQQDEVLVGVVQLQLVATTLVILPCQNGYYDSNTKVLLIVVKEVKRLRYH